MNSIKTIIKYELIRYFTSPLAYVYLISFLLLSGSCAIYFGHFFADDNANLWALFDYQPWIYLLFIPGIAMRTWAEEFRSKSIVQLLTTPVPLSRLVWGKFFASWIFAVFAIMLTFPFWITVNIYGSPDNTVIFIGYLSCFTIAGAMLAISQTMSALTKNPVISLVLSVFVNLIFFWSGFDFVLFWVREFFNDVIVDTIISFSFLSHFSTFSRGLIELRDIIYFASLILFFNLLTIAFIDIKTKSSAKFISASAKRHVILVIILLFIGFFSLNIIANNLFRQISYDFTAEKYLSLSKNTKDILRKIDRPITARLYYSPILGQRNPQTRVLFNQIKLMLKQYKAYSHGKFDYRIYTPQFLDKVEDRALADGLQPIPLIDINQNALFGIVFADSLTNKSVIPFFSIEKFPFLEQDFTTSIYKLYHQKKTVGILSSLPVMGNIRQDNVLIRRWEIINQISELYNIKEIKTPEDIDKSIDVLMLIHPQLLEEDMQKKITEQQKVLLLLDVADDASRIYSPHAGAFYPSELSILADYWKIKFYDNGVVADFDNSITVDETINYKKNPSFTQDLLQFKVGKAELNPNHRITQKLDNLLFSTASVIYPQNTTDISFFPLIRASYNSALMSTDVVTQNLPPREILARFSPQNELLVVAAEILSNNGANPFDIIAVADTDFLYDSFWSTEKKFLDTSYNIPIFDSANFILNALDYLAENDDLIALRSKGLKNRPLYKIDKMRKQNTYRYKIKENEIFDTIDGIRQQLVEITAKRDFEERETFNADELALIGKIRKEMTDLRQQLSSVRLNANQNIARIEAEVKFFNIYFISLLILLIILLVNIKKTSLQQLCLKDFFAFDRQMYKLFSWVIIILLLALLTIYFDNRNNLSQYEDKPVFKDFSQKINSIDKIKLEGSAQKLTFVHKDGLWQLAEEPLLPVYQERIRQFLVALNNMTFAEKKSDRAGDMKYFGISESKDEKNPTINISLYNNQAEPFITFDIGWYNIDYGRGSKAAFIRLEKQFQIWQTEVDFYDLSLNKNAWTYSSLWNLRYGRLIGYNGITDAEKIMRLVKNLLNSNILSVAESVNAQKIGTLKLDVEDNNYVNLEFYKTVDKKYYMQYNFVTPPHGRHLEFVAPYLADKYLEISEQAWEKIKDDTIKAK